MYATFDRNSPASLSADILSLSWKGDSRQGWLAAGNSRKTVGVTYTEMKDCDDESWAWEPEQIFASEAALERQGMRRNFNFREHSSEVGAVCRACLCVRMCTGVYVHKRERKCALSWVPCGRAGTCFGDFKPTRLSSAACFSLRRPVRFSCLGTSAGQSYIFVKPHCAFSAAFSS